MGTVRGAVATVLLASSAIGGAVTVNNVRQEIAKDQSGATPPPARVAAARATPSPTPTPLTAGGLRADAEKRLRAALDQNAQGADDLRKVSTLGASATDEKPFAIETFLDTIAAHAPNGDATRRRHMRRN